MGEACGWRAAEPPAAGSRDQRGDGDPGGEQAGVPQSEAGPRACDAEPHPLLLPQQWWMHD